MGIYLFILVFWAFLDRNDKDRIGKSAAEVVLSLPAKIGNIGKSKSGHHPLFISYLYMEYFQLLVMCSCSLLRQEQSLTWSGSCRVLRPVELQVFAVLSIGFGNAFQRP